MTPFRRFVLARAIAWIGNAMSIVAVPMLVYQLTGSPLLSGVAFAVEALVGEAAGAKDQRKLVACTNRGLFWSSMFALVYALMFFVAGSDIIGLLTDIEALRITAASYLPLMVLMPLAGHWCFLFDGVFVGLTRSGAMRNTMIISALLVFFPVWWYFKDYGNVALWYALLAFLLARGVTLGWEFWKLSKQGALTEKT